MINKLRQQYAARQIANQMGGIYAWRPGRPPR